MILKGLRNITSDRERDLAIKCWILLHKGSLTKLADECFDTATAEVYYNDISDNVFMSDEDHNTILEDGNGKLDLWINLSYHGPEGFLDDLIEMLKDGEVYKEDHDQLRVYLNNEQKEELETIFAEAKI